jgi:hypothetical protein
MKCTVRTHCGRGCSSCTGSPPRVAMADRFFQKIANDVLEASEKISARLEDGISAIFSGELPASGQPDDPNRAGGQPNDDPASSFPSGGVGGDTDYGSSHAFEETIELLEDEEAYGGTPLEGIARGVIGNIMANQVRPAPIERAAAAPRTSACASCNRIALTAAVFFLTSRLDPRRHGTTSTRSGTLSLGRNRLSCLCSRSTSACSSPACLRPVGAGGCTLVLWS